MTIRFTVGEVQATSEGYAIRVTDSVTGKRWTQGVYGSFAAACADRPNIVAAFAVGGRAVS